MHIDTVQQTRRLSLLPSRGQHSSYTQVTSASYPHWVQPRASITRTCIRCTWTQYSKQVDSASYPHRDNTAVTLRPTQPPTLTRMTHQLHLDIQVSKLCKVTTLKENPNRSHLICQPKAEASNQIRSRLLQWLCHHESTVNIVVVITNYYYHLLR